MEARDLSFEVIAVGQRAEFARTISAQEVAEFARLTGDCNPLHMDETFARTTRFGARVVHGMLVASHFSTLIGMYLPGRRALYVGQDLAFVRPVHIGDTIRVVGEVVQKSTATRMLMLKTEVYNQRAELVVRGTAKALVLEGG